MQPKDSMENVGKGMFADGREIMSCATYLHWRWGSLKECRWMSLCFDFNNKHSSLMGVKNRAGTANSSRLHTEFPARSSPGHIYNTHENM